MEIKVNAGQVVIVIVQIIGYVVTALGLAYHFGRKVEKMESKIIHTAEKWDELADRVEKISDRMWEQKAHPRRTS